MPPTRSTRSKKAKAKQNPVHNTPTPDPIERTFSRVRSDEIGLPLKNFYRSKVIPEFVVDPRLQGVTVPETNRPLPLSLNNLACLRTLDLCTNGRLLLASSERSNDRLPTGERALFAVKAVRRKEFRTVVSELAAQDKPTDGNVIAALAKQYLKFQSKERSVLATLPWDPFVAGLIQTFEDSQALYMTLEFLPGGSLRSLLRKSPKGLEFKSASFYLGNIVCGLDFLRGQGIAHRNLRPESILVGGDGYLSLSNFEAATRFDNKKCRWTMITREYAPPECHPLAGGPVKIVPEAIDWWSTGCILFEMITGKMAFSEESGEKSESRDRRREKFQAIWSQRGEFGKKLVDLVQRLLEVDPVERLGTKGVDEVKEHPWLFLLDWPYMRRRGYLAPFLPEDIGHSQLWHDLPLPKQEYIPGLKILHPHIHLAHDNRSPGKPAT